MAAMRRLKYFLKPQFLFKVAAERPRPVVEIAGNNERPFMRYKLLDISSQFPGMLRAFPMSQTKMRTDQSEQAAILSAHIRMENGPRLLLRGFRKRVIAPMDDGIAT
jgi:hypothetical protein